VCPHCLICHLVPKKRPKTIRFNLNLIPQVQRCLNIWTERQVFSEKFVSELSAIIKQNRAEQDLIDNFQPQQLCTQIKIMRALEDDTDYKLKTLREADLNLVTQTSFSSISGLQLKMGIFFKMTTLDKFC